MRGEFFLRQRSSMPSGAIALHYAGDDVAVSARQAVFIENIAHRNALIKNA
jgi:hypothetical protein